MTDKELATFMVKHFQQMLEVDEWELDNIKKDLARYREEDKKLVEHIWAKGVVTRLDMEIFCVENFMGADTKETLRKRSRVYRDRSYHRKQLEYWKRREQVAAT